MSSTQLSAFINVTHPPFSADPRGTVDSTQAFQAALDAASNNAMPLEKRQPNTVFVPAGIYRIDGHISVPPYVTLEGTWDSPPDCGAFFPSPNQPVTKREWWNPDVYRPFLKGTALVTDYGRDRRPLQCACIHNSYWAEQYYQRNLDLLSAPGCSRRSFAAASGYSISMDNSGNE